MDDNIYNSGEYKAKNPNWHAEDSEWKATQILNILKSNKLDQPGTLCEVGCGFGGILECLQENMTDKTQFSGYEIAEFAFQKCLEKKNTNIDFFMEDLLKDSNKAFFEVLLIIDVIEHIEDCFDFARKLKNKAEYKVFHIPLDMTAMTVFKETPILNARKEVGHLHYFSKSTALALLEDCGYEIIDYAYTGSYVDFKPKSFRAFLGKGYRKVLAKISKDFTARVFGGYSLLVLAK